MIDIINREVALLLKEKGFSWDYDFMWGYYGYHYEYNNLNPYNKNENYNIPAPTFSEVIRWIKEKYNFDVFAFPIGKLYHGHIVDCKNKSIIRIVKKSYDEALAACIIQTLNDYEKTTA